MSRARWKGGEGKNVREGKEGKVDRENDREMGGKREIMKYRREVEGCLFTVREVKNVREMKGREEGRGRLAGR